MGRWVDGKGRARLGRYIERKRKDRMSSGSWYARACVCVCMCVCVGRAYITSNSCIQTYFFPLLFFFGFASLNYFYLLLPPCDEGGAFTGLWIVKHSIPHLSSSRYILVIYTYDVDPGSQHLNFKKRRKKKKRKFRELGVTCRCP